MFCIGTKKSNKEKTQPRDSSVTGVRGIRKGLTSLSPNNRIAPVDTQTPGVHQGRRPGISEPTRSFKDTNIVKGMSDKKLNKMQL